MDSVFTLALPFFGLIFLGFFAGKMFRRDAGGLDWLNIFIVYFALPALFFRLLSRTPFDELVNGQFILATTLTTFIVFASTVILAIAIGRSSLSQAAIQGGAASYGNIGYMGPGLALGALGIKAAVPATLIICFDNALLFTLIPLLVAIDRRQGEGFFASAGVILLKVVTHPFIAASLAGFLASYLELRPPEAIEKLLDMLSAAAAPCALFALGVTVALRPLRKVPYDIPFLMMAKLVIQPALAFVVLTLLGPFDPLWLMTAMLLASLPPATNVFVLAQQFNVYVERASSAILVGTVISVASVTGLLYLINKGIVP